MWQSAQDSYLESRVLSADPIELIRLLYGAATASVREARRHLATGAIAERARAITKACQILSELTASLDYERGGEIAPRLAQLYDYMGRQLIEANVRQLDAPLEEVLTLLGTLSEGWDGIQAEAAVESAAFEPVAVPESAWSRPGEQTDNPWAPPVTTESPWPHRVEEPASPWAQPHEPIENPLAQLAARVENPWPESVETPNNPWAPPLERAYSPWAQPADRAEDVWSTPPPEAAESNASRAWSF